MKQWEFWYTVARSINLYNHYGKLTLSINTFNSGISLASLYNKYILHKMLIIRMFTVPLFVTASNCKQRQMPNSNMAYVYNIL